MELDHEHEHLGRIIRKAAAVDEREVCGMIPLEVYIQKEPRLYEPIRHVQNVHTIGLLHVWGLWFWGLRFVQSRGSVY